jgi:hypothetical protein
MASRSSVSASGWKINRIQGCAGRPGPVVEPLMRVRVEDDEGRDLGEDQDRNEDTPRVGLPGRRGTGAERHAGAGMKTRLVDLRKLSRSHVIDNMKA